MHHALVGQIAGFLALVSFFPYIRSILRKETKPERATYAIWSVVNIVTLLSYFAAGARDTVWLVLVYAIFQLVIFGLSFKYGMGGFNKLDVICLSGAAVGVALWIITKNPLIALYISIFVEFLGWIPTLKKSYLLPETENTLSWTIAATATIINLFALSSFELKFALYPIYILLGDGIIALLLLFPKARFLRES